MAATHLGVRDEHARAPSGGERAHGLCSSVFPRRTPRPKAHAPMVSRSVSMAQHTRTCGAASARGVVAVLALASSAGCCSVGNVCVSGREDVAAAAAVCQRQACATASRPRFMSITHKSAPRSPALLLR
jgi:hypothetical protein